ncbi:hypothetical protein BJ546DRAFT_593972 [Cryomyces antarcticus]
MQHIVPTRAPRTAAGCFYRAFYQWSRHDSTYSFADGQHCTKQSSQNPKRRASLFCSSAARTPQRVGENFVRWQSSVSEEAPPNQAHPSQNGKTSVLGTRGSTTLRDEPPPEAGSPESTENTFLALSVPRGSVSRIIGKNGIVVAAMQRQYGVTIAVKEPRSEASSLAKIVVSSPDSRKADDARLLIKEIAATGFTGLLATQFLLANPALNSAIPVVPDQQRDRDANITNTPEAGWLTLLVPEEKVKHIIGAGGRVLRNIEDRYDVRVGRSGPGGATLRITGAPQNTAQAQAFIGEMLGKLENRFREVPIRSRPEEKTFSFGRSQAVSSRPDSQDQQLGHNVSGLGRTMQKPSNPTDDADQHSVTVAKDGGSEVDTQYVLVPAAASRFIIGVRARLSEKQRTALECLCHG